ncbi:hypothetical protein D3C72_1663240 [compost metagenome]
MRVGLGAKADAPVNLDVKAGVLKRRRARHDQRALGQQRPVSVLVRQGDSGEGHEIPRAAGRQGHVGAVMFYRLEAADWPSELLPHARIGDSHFKRGLRHAGQDGGIQQPQTRHLGFIQSRLDFGRRGHI